MIVTEEMFNVFLEKAKPVDEKWFKKLSTANKQAKSDCGNAEHVHMPYETHHHGEGHKHHPTIDSESKIAAV